MRIGHSLHSFCCGRLLYARQTVGKGWGKYMVEAWRGLRYTRMRAVHVGTGRETLGYTWRNEDWDCFDNASHVETTMSFLRKVVRPPDSAIAATGAVDAELLGSYPALHEHLTALVDGEGERRQTCSLTVFGGSGCFKGFLNDRDQGCSIGVEARSLAGLLEALEAELEADAPRWVFKDKGRRPVQRKQDRRS